MIAVSALCHRRLRAALLATAFAAPLFTGQAQTGITVYTPAVVRPSTAGTTIPNPITFGSAPINLSCPAQPITAVLSSTPDGASNLLVDNYLALTVAQGTGAPVGPVNLCGTSAPGQNPASCFRAAYGTPAGKGQLNGVDVDGAVAASGGLPPIDIHSYLAPGANQVKLDQVDFGGYLTSSSVYLYTNCSPNGASGGGVVTGNPISPTNPTAASLNQNFSFSSGKNASGTPLEVQLVFDLSKANSANTLDIPPNGATPKVADAAINPKDFPGYVAGTSFATSQCLIHNGELFNNKPACKLFTLTCQAGQDSEQSGIKCPTSTARNVVIQDAFDFPSFTLPNYEAVIDGVKRTFHQGFGFLEASEGWTGGPCTFDPAAGQAFSCPENLLTQFTGPGFGRATGTPQPGINSSFISVGPVPEYLTNVTFTGWAHRKWINTHSTEATFITYSPALPPDFHKGVLNGFAAAPLYGITYGVSSLFDLPSTEFPVPGDLTLAYPGGCPAVGTPAPKSYQPAPVPIQVAEDGAYVVHFFATDCAGTEELSFSKDDKGNWSTQFYTASLFVDTVAPKVVAGPLLSPPPTLISGVLGYKRNTVVTATYQCSDDFSGVEQCGPNYDYSAYVSTRPAAFTTTVDTSGVGTKVFKVAVHDAAQNQGRVESVAYTVVGP